MILCKADGCARESKTRGYCGMHYQRLRSTGRIEILHHPKVCSVDGCLNKCKQKGLCAKHIARKKRNGDTDARRIVGNDKERLMANSVAMENGCRQWIKNIKLGYGVTTINGRHEQAHRASWFTFVGPIPEGLQVNHKCHNRACINPDHLYLGDQKQNMSDMRESGREIKVRGELSKSAKLTEAQVIQIIKDTRKLADIAAEYSITKSSASAIRRRQSWKHVCV